MFHEVRSSTTVRKENKGNEAAKTAGVTYHVHCIFLSYTHAWDHLLIVTTQSTKTHVRMPLRAWYVFFSSGIASGTLIIVKLQIRPCLFFVPSKHVLDRLTFRTLIIFFYGLLGRCSEITSRIRIRMCYRGSIYCIQISFFACKVRIRILFHAQNLVEVLVAYSLIQTGA